jgi:hypothetical protein
MVVGGERRKKRAAAWRRGWDGRVSGSGVLCRASVVADEREGRERDRPHSPLVQHRKMLRAHDGIGTTVTSDPSLLFFVCVWCVGTTSHSII